MKIEPVNEYRVEIELADSEMAELGISYEGLDWTDVETRRALWNILNMVRESGIELSFSGKVLIEAGKLKNGCRLSFTVLPPKNDRVCVRPIIKGEAFTALVSRDKKNIDAAASFFENGEKRLYEKDGAFVLTVSGERGDDDLLRASEFCQVARLQGPVARAILEEHFVRLDRLLTGIADTGRT